jgi:tetratricopeptide (TPR) repeat protein
MNNLAETLRAQGDLTGARALQEQVLELRRRVLGAEHPDIAASLRALAETLQAEGRTEEALQLYRTAAEGQLKRAQPLR